MLQDDVFGSRCAQYLEAGFFQLEAFGWAFKFYKHYLEEYGAKPTDIAVRHELRRLSSDKFMLYAGEIEFALMPGGVPEAEYIKAQLREFVRMNLFVEAHRESAKRFTAGEYAQAYEIFREANDRMGTIQFERPARQWFFEELADRQVRRVTEQSDIRAVPRMTGIPDLDRITDGGVHNGELWAVFAYAKRCKSTWLINQGFNATRIHKQPTLHVQLEGSPKQCSDKYDACFSRELYTRVKLGEINAEAFLSLQDEYQRLRKLLVIRTFNDWDMNMGHVLNELNELKAQGFEPTTLIVDYIDLLRSRSSRVDSELQHQLDASRDLKRLINEREYAGWTAWQAQRPKPGALQREHVLTSANVADAYAKVRVVDSWGSLNATDEEMARNEMRVYWEGHRDAPVGKLYRITNELATMRMIETSEEIDFRATGDGA